MFAFFEFMETVDDQEYTFELDHFFSLERLRGYFRYLKDYSTYKASSIHNKANNIKRVRTDQLGLLFPFPP